MSTAELSVKSSITLINIAFFHTLYVLMVKDIVICVDITNKQTTILETCIKHNFSYVLVWTQRFLVLWWTNIYSQKNMSIDLKVLLQNECHSIIQPSVWLNFLCKWNVFLNYNQEIFDTAVGESIYRHCADNHGDSSHRRDTNWSVRGCLYPDLTSDLPLPRRVCYNWPRELDTGPPDNHQKTIVPSTQILVLTGGDD